MKELFETDPARAERFSIDMPQIYLDFSKNRITDIIFIQLAEFARETKLEQWREDMFSGKRINQTEDRSVLHVALRNQSRQPVLVNGVNITEQVESQLSRIKNFVSNVRQGNWKGFSDKRIKDIVSIGVGGSNLGPQTVTEAMVHFNGDALRVHYVSNVDATQISEALGPFWKLIQCALLRWLPNCTSSQLVEPFAD